MLTQVDTCFSVSSSGGGGTLGTGMVFDLFVQVYKTNDVSMLWRGFCPLCCAKQGMYFMDVCPKQKNQILGGSSMLKWLSTLPPGIVMFVLRRSDFDS